MSKTCNELGDHAKAEAVCSDALSRLHTGVLGFVPFTLALQTELALARAGQSRFDEAEAQLEQLQRDHADKGPLARGWLHRVRARVAHMRGDLDRIRVELECMEQHYQATNIPSLQRLSAELRREMLQEQLGQTSAELPLTVHDGHLIARIQLALTSGSKDVEEGAQSALKSALELGGAAHGFIVYPDRTVVASPEHTPSDAAIDWAYERLESAEEVEDDTAIADADGCAESYGRRCTAEGLRPLASSAALPAFSTRGPKTVGDHPLARRLHGGRQTMQLGELLLRQRRPKSAYSARTMLSAFTR